MWKGQPQVEYEDLYKVARAGTDPEWAAFHWASADILPPEEIASARRRMDPRLFEQEMLGQFVLTGGRAFPDFHAESHVQPTRYDPDLPICWSLDFNINPMCSGVIQHKDGKISVIEELVLPDTKTDLAVTAFFRSGSHARLEPAGHANLWRCFWQLPGQHQRYQ